MELLVALFVILGALLVYWLFVSVLGLGSGRGRRRPRR
jgi:hypothetical protein